MSKIIINNKSKSSDYSALLLVGFVMAQGKISTHKGEPCHCLCSVFGESVVLVTRNDSGSETFTIQDK